jgi:uncharacterized protein (DUF2141 family)
MNKILAALFFLVFCNGAAAQGRIIVTIANLTSDKGVCKTCLFDNADSFVGNGSAFKCANLKIQNKIAVFVFDAVPTGIYAIAVFHDENNNNKMDKNFLGIPKEGYGASKNKLPFASAPTFRDNQFEVSAASNLNISIRLRNL